MIIETSFSKPVLKENIRLTSWMIEKLQKDKSLFKSFSDNITYHKNTYNKEYTKEAFVKAFLEVYNNYACLKHILHTSNTIDSIDMYCKQLGSHRDLQCYKLINSSAERFKAWSTVDYCQLCLDLSKKLSSTEVQSVIHAYFVFLAREKPSNHGLDTFFEYDAPHNAYCCALFEKNYRVYTGLKTEHEYIIKPITLEVVKNANNYYRKLYNSMSN